jgi:hypothetical protein
MKGGVSAEVPTTFAPDDDEERRSTLLLRDEWSSLRVPSAATTSLAVWTSTRRLTRQPPCACIGLGLRSSTQGPTPRSQIVHSGRVRFDTGRARIHSEAAARVSVERSSPGIALLRQREATGCGSSARPCSIRGVCHSRRRARIRFVAMETSLAAQGFAAIPAPGRPAPIYSGASWLVGSAGDSAARIASAQRSSSVTSRPRRRASGSRSSSRIHSASSRVATNRATASR